MERQIVVLDANILFPAPLRDFFMHLALQDAVQVHWSKRIEDEWTRNLLVKRPDLAPERVYRTTVQMNAALPDAQITDFEMLEPGLVLPDPKDRHVLAAAVKAGAEVIITKNLRDFPLEAISKFGIAAQHPDAFIYHLLQLEPSPVILALEAVQANLKNPVKTQLEILETLEQQDMPRTAAQLRELLQK